MPNEVFVHVLPATQVLNLEIVEGLFTRSDFIIFHFEKFATWPFRQNTVYGKTSGEPVADWTFTIFNRRRILANFRMASSVPATPLDNGWGIKIQKIGMACWSAKEWRIQLMSSASEIPKETCEHFNAIKMCEIFPDILCEKVP